MLELKSPWIILLLSLFTSVLSWTTYADSTPENTTDSIVFGKRIYSIMAGAPISPRDPQFETIIGLSAEKNFDAILNLAMKEKGFLSSTALNWANFYFNKGSPVTNSFNDAIALGLGVIRDDLDARTLGTGDFSYGAPLRVGLGRNSLISNEHYSKFSAINSNFTQTLFAYTPQWNAQGFSDAAGLMTTREWAKKYYSDGTNRRPVVGAYDVFLCTPIDLWKKADLSDRWIRRDIPRTPAGNFKTFQNECRTCHSVLDAMSPAFAYADFKNEEFIMSVAVQNKFKQHEDVYPEGFVPQDDRWDNLLAPSTKDAFGWRGAVNGKGLHELGNMFTQAKGFNACIVKRSYEYLCNGSVSLGDPLVQRLANQFETEDQFHLKNLLKRILLEPRCHEDLQELGSSTIVPEKKD